VSFAEFDQPKFIGILVYLQRRFKVIGTLEDQGYEVGWSRST
jgi:hypothetical protein